ncbi:MAG: pyridoxal 5'-phosphate synthase glutaminase subunit PdxT [Nitrosomonadales bacterium]|nr:pyridoxal 5'-phosphate synthase glutaminase subunit PdxT [Nitrosomonadales bacterium]
MAGSTLNIGVLALQGAFTEHCDRLRQLGANVVEVRKPEQLTQLQGLIIPGGESTAMSLIAERWGLVAPLRAWVRAGKPVWGTCAGLIFLAERVEGQKVGGQALIGGLDVSVNRNYFGRQINSFQAMLETSVSEDDTATFPAIFIRAPVITAIGRAVEPLAYLSTSDGRKCIVAVRQGNILATAFHPELTADNSWHQFFIGMVRQFNKPVKA